MTAEAAAWPWRVALETLGHDAAAAPPHTLAKLIEGEKLPWVVARVEKALRREDAAADAVFVLGDDSGATMVAQFSTRAAAQAGGEVRAGSVVAVRRPATLRGAGDDACLVVDAPDLVVAVPPDARPVHGAAGRRGRCRCFRTRPGPGPGLAATRGAVAASPGRADSPSAAAPPRRLDARRRRRRWLRPRRCASTGKTADPAGRAPSAIAPDGGGDDVDAPYASAAKVATAARHSSSSESKGRRLKTKLRMETTRHAGCAVGWHHWQAQAGCKAHERSTVPFGTGAGRAGGNHRRIDPRAQLGPSGRANLNGRMRNRMSAWRPELLFRPRRRRPRRGRPWPAQGGRRVFTTAHWHLTHPACNSA